MDAGTLEGGTNQMNHYSRNEWLAYLNGQCTENQSIAYEDHLYECEACLQVYMNCAEEQSVISPKLQDKQYVEKLVTKWDRQATRTILPKLSNRPIVLPYSIAAVATIILMFSGLFETLFVQVGSLQANMEAVSDASYSERALDLFGSWLDRVKVK